MAKTNPSIKPTFDYVLVRPLEMEQRTPSGIIIPDSATKKPQVGIIMEVGPGKRSSDGKTIPMTLKKGQKVIYSEWVGKETKVGNEEWLLIEEKNVMAIVS